MLGQSTVIAPKCHTIHRGILKTGRPFLVMSISLLDVVPLRTRNNRARGEATSKLSGGGGRGIPHRHDGRLRRADGQRGLPI
jgi:hypothetical protein